MIGRGRFICAVNDYTCYIFSYANLFSEYMRESLVFVAITRDTHLLFIFHSHSKYLSNLFSQVAYYTIHLLCTTLTLSTGLQCIGQK